jgi:CRP-like cAMP-binding protein
VATLPHRRPDVGLRLAFIAQAPLFRGLSDEGRHEAATRAQDRHLRRRETLFREGEEGGETSVLGTGRLKITQLAANGQEVLIRLVGPGEVCGALGLPPGGSHSCGAQALETTHALVWEARALEELLDRHPVLRRNALRIQSERLRALEERHRELATERVPPRLARALVRLVGHVGRPCDEGVLVALSREELAQMTGTTLFTVSRLLSEWESRGLVRGRREAVLVADLRGLAEFAASNEVAGGL